MPANKNKSGVNVRLSAYKPPAADKKIKKLPYSGNSSVNSKSKEADCNFGGVVYMKVYSVKLKKGSAYNFTLNGKGMGDPVMNIIDSKGYLAESFTVFRDGEGEDLQRYARHIALGSFTSPQTETYKIEVYDNYYYSSDEEDERGNGKFSLSVSKAFIPGSISGMVKRTGGYANSSVIVIAYKKYGKRWMPYIGSTTGADGTYSLKGLKSGSYRISFSDYHKSRFYKKGKLKGVKKISSASKIKVYAGGTTRGVDMKF
jgi:hypothetical protein